MQTKPPAILSEEEAEAVAMGLVSGCLFVSIDTITLIKAQLFDWGLSAPVTENGLPSFPRPGSMGHVSSGHRSDVEGSLSLASPLLCSVPAKPQSYSETSHSAG